VPQSFLTFLATYHRHAPVRGILNDRGSLAPIAAGYDIAANWLVQARRSAAAEGLTIVFEEGDAEALPYGNAAFDAVVSLIGAMFAPRPELVAAELTRVCRPGGIIAMANWTGPGFVGQIFKTIAKHISPSGMPSPVLWGDEATVRERLREGIENLECTRHLYEFSYPFSPADVVEFFRVNYGPMTRAFASIGEGAQMQLRGELTDLWVGHNQATDGTTPVEAEYLEVLAVRG
jgi:SAM-dependent methyltransferase